MDKSIISVNKLRFQRGYSYLSMFGIAFLVARELERFSMQLGLDIPLLVFFLLGVGTIWFVGYIDIKYGFWGRELEYSFQKNPEWMNRKGDWHKQKTAAEELREKMKSIDTERSEK